MFDGSIKYWKGLGQVFRLSNLCKQNYIHEHEINPKYNKIENLHSMINNSILPLTYVENKLQRKQ